MAKSIASRIKKVLYFLSMSEMIEATVSEPLIIRYTCSKCGRRNETKTRFSQTCTDGLDYLKRKDASARSTAQTRAKVGAINRFLKKKSIVQNGSAVRAARTVRAACRCAGCGHREPWAIVKHPFALAAILTGAAAGLICVLLKLSSCLTWSNVFYPLLGAAALILLAVGAEAILYAVRAAQTRRLPPESLPQFVFPRDEERREGAED